MLTTTGLTTGLTDTQGRDYSFMGMDFNKQFLDCYKMG